jgi:hypothetical protein
LRARTTILINDLERSQTRVYSSAVEWIRSVFNPSELDTLDEIMFKKALDEFARAEMRFGK